MTLQTYLIDKFKSWKPKPALVVGRTKCDVTLEWKQEKYKFLEDQFLYRVEKKEKIPPWKIVYSGAKTSKRIDNLPPSHPHKFRLKVILKSTAVQSVAAKAINFFGDEDTIREKMETDENNKNSEYVNCLKTDYFNDIEVYKDGGLYLKKGFDENNQMSLNQRKSEIRSKEENRLIESLWSEETWTSTDTDGTSSVCFSMAVKCGYIKQVQIMLEERPGLIGIMNSNNGFTPLATAVRKGDINTVRFLLSAGAEIDQTSSTGQTALHLAVLAGNLAIAELLIEKRANIRAQDLNSLHVEHYAVDSCNLDMLKYILSVGGDVTVRDNNGWTPLFRAVSQGTKTEIIDELIQRGSDVEVKDRRGLSLTHVARLLKNRHGRSRDSVLRLVDAQYPHEKAFANFTRLTKKISSVHSLTSIK